MKILMICQHYWPEHFQITEVCEELVRRGHDVTALVGVPNYPTGVVPDEYLGGKNRLQERNGVRIVRVEEVPRKNGIAGLARNYFSYMAAAKRKARELPGDFDIVFAYQITPVLMAAPMRDAKLRSGCPAFLYCADIWPDAVMAMLPKKLSFLMPAVKAASTHIYRDADFVATNSSAYVECFEKVHGFDPVDLKYVPQYAEDTYLSMNLDPSPSTKTRFMVMGNIGRLQDMPSVLEAVNRIKHRDDFELHIVGTGSVIGDCERYVGDNGLEGKVIFHGRHPFEEMPDFYRMADACVLTLNVPRAPWISSTLPSRLQGYMAAGKPILAAISGSAAEVIRDSGCGQAAPAGDSEGLAALMEDFIDNRAAYSGCGEAGRAYFRANFTKDRYMDEIESLLIATASRTER
ncbi:glycosyltransferase family 4 protein [uncultured Senegalimassilia sp.]|uniref:glycosyltransferase family 4 protein n=1 Tax=uncultured Senegalimassilia sp. TaxID=1714350 RepID=UPI0025E9A91A|nr:glycosyltransferase family 4 protein [uncultured Senegalimassilia sp.]